jgi:hypothetical protein
MESKMIRGIQILEHEIDPSDLYPEGVYYELRMIIPDVIEPRVVTSENLRTVMQRANMFMIHGMVGE